LHTHLMGLPRDEQQRFLLSLTGPQRNEVASSISSLSRRAASKQRDKSRPMSVSSSAPSIRPKTEEGCWGDVLRFSKVLDRTSSRRKAPLYTFNKTTRYPPVRYSRNPGDEVDLWASSLRVGVNERTFLSSASGDRSLLGPGAYPLECDFPTDNFELKSGLITRNHHIIRFRRLPQDEAERRL